MPDSGSPYHCGISGLKLNMSVLFEYIETASHLDGANRIIKSRKAKNTRGHQHTIFVFLLPRSESVTLTESGNATEVFRDSSGLTTAAYDGSATNNDSALECSGGGTIAASYTDGQDGDDTQSDTATATTDTIPTVPSSLSGSAGSSTSITWSWTDNSKGFHRCALWA